MSVSAVRGVATSPSASYQNSPYNGLLTANSPWYTGVASHTFVETARNLLASGVADQLGLDPAELNRQLSDGASLVEIAAAKDIAVAKVVEAIKTMMVPNANLNGDFVQRIALHKTAPIHVRHRDRPAAAPAPAPVIPGARKPMADHATHGDRTTWSTEATQSALGTQAAVTVQPVAHPSGTTPALPENPSRFNVYV